ncbi:MAG: EFR1 family ferrodoxin [Verrucomicrobia bacterium]|nr:EFR1 family ferrodoxin [Verrucomicrobiota bacterium]
MKTHTLFFSPTQTGATIAKTVQNALETEAGESFDITKTAIEKTFGADDVVIIAMPIYSGRLPPIGAERFNAARGNGAKAVAITMRGNANTGDALLELTDLCTEQGFEVIAAATFIGEHSFTMKEFPIAVGRPDAADLQKAADFAQLIQERLHTEGPLAPPAVPGTRPYKDAMNPPGTAATGTNPENCTRCGLCQTFCPTGAITLTADGPQTDDSKCIWCAACVKVCTSHARAFTLPKIKEIAERLYQTCQTRQKPEWFLAQKGN